MSPISIIQPSQPSTSSVNTAPSSHPTVAPPRSSRAARRCTPGRALPVRQGNMLPAGNGMAAALTRTFSVTGGKRRSRSALVVCVRQGKETRVVLTVLGGVTHLVSAYSGRPATMPRASRLPMQPRNRASADRVHVTKKGLNRWAHSVSYGPGTGRPPAGRRSSHHMASAKDTAGGECPFR